MFGERLFRARAASGLSMRELGVLAGVSANMIKKYEHNESMPGSAVLLKISRALGVRNEYFFRPTTIELKEIEYRKRSNLTKKALTRIHADIIDQVERWMELAALWPHFPVPTFTAPRFTTRRLTNYDEVEKAANSLREEWGLGSQPVSSLIDLLERQGILVIVTQADHAEKFDGCQAKVNGMPVIVISGKWPGDRQRFTLAHELGHLVLHHRLADELDEEKACHRFAGAFLLPASTMRQRLGARRHTLEVRELYMLKQEAGLSMMACVYRAADLGIISDQTRQKLFMLFSLRHWRTLEPGEACPPEETSLFAQLVFRGLGEGIISESKAAELLGISLSQFHRARKLESPDVDSYQ